jgi:1-acyl-sn-glycerol-3-phosphate acyltransferase
MALRNLLPPVVRGSIAALLFAVNTVFWCTPLFAFAIVRLLLPFAAVRRAIDRVLNAIATGWIACNSGWMRLMLPTRWDVQGVEALRYGGWYLVVSNHQSWSDILVLQHVLNRRIPMLKFFLKKELIYVPLLGLAWWALDFPFMARHGKKALEKNPALRGQDRETTRRACEKFSLVPTSVMSFAEGTRFTQAKHDAQQSPYRHLLKPKAGAIALSLDAMGERFRSLVDVTIVYPGGAGSVWRFLCGDVRQVVVRVQQRPIPVELLRGDYTEDAAFRARFLAWLEGLWADKDAQIDEIVGQPHGDRLPRPAVVAGRDSLSS